MIDEWHQPEDLVRKLLGIMEGLHHLKDLDALLDQVLLQARRLTAADAGSIYLIVTSGLALQLRPQRHPV